MQGAQVRGLDKNTVFITSITYRNSKEGVVTGNKADLNVRKRRDRSGTMGELKATELQNIKRTQRAWEVTVLGSG